MSQSLRQRSDSSEGNDTSALTKLPSSFSIRNIAVGIWPTLANYKLKIRHLFSDGKRPTAFAFLPSAATLPYLHLSFVLIWTFSVKVLSFYINRLGSYDDDDDDYDDGDDDDDDLLTSAAELLTLMSLAPSPCLVFPLNIFKFDLNSAWNRVPWKALLMSLQDFKPLSNRLFSFTSSPDFF